MKIRFKKIIDLTLPIQSGMATYPGERISYRPASVIPKDKHNVQSMQILTHTGTHIDAPYHIFKKGRQIDAYHLNKFIAKSFKIDLTKYKKELSKIGSFSYLKVIKKRHLLPCRKEIGKAEALILQTGYGNILKTGEKLIDFEFPYFSEDAAKYIAQFRNLKLIGVDSLTIDKHGVTTCHKIILGKAKIPIVETLINLDKAPEKFILICFPLHIKNADGAPCRALALV